MRGVLHLVAALSVGLAGCSANEYVDRRETLLASSGEANARNLIVHTIDPWPREAFDARIADSGQRAAKGIKRYRCGTSQVPDGGSQTESSSSGFASRGQIVINTQSSTRPTTQEVTNDC